jgi:ERCC4-type nuclease
MPIIVDTRGKGEAEIAKFLKEKNLLVEYRHIDSGDIVLVGPDTTVAIERKSISDLVGSVVGSKNSWDKTNHHLWKQIETMKNTYKHSLVIIEGVIDMDNRTVCGIYTSLVVDWGIPVINTLDTKDTASIIAKLFTKYGAHRVASLHLPDAVRKSKNMRQIRLAMLCCVEGIGLATAKKLIEAEPLLLSTVLGEEYVKKLLKEIIGNNTPNQKAIQKRLLSVLYNSEE